MSQTRALLTPATKHKLMLTAQGLTCAIGMGAGMLYFAPAKACANEETCGTWLSDLLSPAIAQTIFFGTGAFEFGVINAFFSLDSIPQATQYIQSFPTLKSQIIQSATLATLTVTQTLQLLIACLGTGSALWQTALTVAGGLPGALYGTVGLMENEIPLLKEKAQHIWQQRQSLNSLSPELARKRKQTTYYKQAQKQAIRQGNANWQALVRHYDTLALPATAERDALGYLYHTPSEIEQQTRTQVALDFTGKALGFTTMLSFTIPFELNTYHVLGKIMPTDVLPIALTGILSIAQIYGNIKLTSSTFTQFFKMLHDLAHHHPIQYLPFRMLPKTTILITSLNIVTAALSYCVANLITTQDYDGPGKEVLRNAAMMGIAIYHLNGLLHLYEVLLARLSKNEKSQFVFEMERKLEELKTMRVATFQEKVEASDERFRTVLGITPFAEEKDEEKAEEKIDQPEDAPLRTTLSLNTEASDQTDTPLKSKSSLLSAWCCFNRPARVDTRRERLLSEEDISATYSP